MGLVDTNSAGVFFSSQCVSIVLRPKSLGMYIGCSYIHLNLYDLRDIIFAVPIAKTTKTTYRVFNLVAGITCVFDPQKCCDIATESITFNIQNFILHKSINQNIQTDRVIKTEKGDLTKTCLHNLTRSCNLY